EKDGVFAPDRLKHEQTLVFESDSGLVVLNSCCHSGAEKVIREVQDVFPGQKIAALIGGFHLMGVDGAETMAGSREEVEKLAKDLQPMGESGLYTGHCTGTPAFEILHAARGEPRNYFV